MQIPKPKDMAIAIASTSLTIEQKREIIKSLIYLNEERIAKLYELLLNLREEEKKFVQQVERVDLKYRIKLEEEIEKAKKAQS